MATTAQMNIKYNEGRWSGTDYSRSYTLHHLITTTCQANAKATCIKGLTGLRISYIKASIVLFNRVAIYR